MIEIYFNLCYKTKLYLKLYVQKICNFAANIKMETAFKMNTAHDRYCMATLKSSLFVSLKDILFAK